MKKRLIVLSVGCMVMQAIQAQDVIVKLDGTTIVSKVLEIGNNEVKYKKYSNLDGPTYTVATSDLQSINYANGEQDKFDRQTTVQSSNVQPSVASPGADNAALMALYNNIDVQFIDKVKDKKAKMLYCQLGVTSGSVLTDGNVRLTFATGNTKSQNYDDPPGFYKSGFSQDMKMEVTVYNLQNRIVYIDLANTFILRNGEAMAFYVPTATSTTTTTGNGVSVNMGAVAGAMGVGGAAGTLASGVTVGGGKSKGTTNTVYSQRIISIPPMSAKKLDLQDLFPPSSVYPLFKAGYTFGGFGTKLNCAHSVTNIDIGVGEVREWDELTSPQTFGINVAYSYNEDCQQLTNMRKYLYETDDRGDKRWLRI